MTSRERILAMLKGEKVDRIPWVPKMVGDYLSSLEGWPAGDGPQGLENLDLARRQVRFMRELYQRIGADMVPYNRPQYYRTRLDSGVRESTQPKGELRVERIETPRGSLTRSREYREGYWYIMDPWLRTPEDCEAYSYYLDAQIIEEDFAEAEMFLQEIGESGIPYPSGPTPAVKTFMIHFTMKPVQLVEGLMDHEPHLMSLLQRWHRRNLRIYEVAARSPLPVFQDGGTTSNNMMSPAIYREFCVPQMREYCDLLHAAGKSKVDHAAGEPFRGILRDIPQSGVDCLMGFREETPGNATLEEIREAWQGRVCIMGGIDTDTLCRWEPDALAKRWEAFFRRIRPDDRMILATSSATVPGTPVENLMRVRDVAEEHLWSRERPVRN